ncbi:2'-5' RNA ligase family protein [Actinomadura logoneensis]|uniref:2'-5' RNA ligase family protein n=2 Tax=Actinomadura logoneensis TaxID=2293572 RepID=A0A372JPI2_9ACTN|nr:2'-5' RNA ligase family protein [Actinomadura logoneensis]
MTDHWWWRPGVRPGRRLLVWHILLEDKPDARALVAQCQGRLANIHGLDLVPETWLHMTTQIVGFADEIPELEVTAMIAAAEAHLKGVFPISVELGRLWFHSEAVMLGVRPGRAFDPVRRAIRAAVAGAITNHQLADEPEWTPHVSVAYSNSSGPAAPVLRALAEPPPQCPFTVRSINLVSQERTGHLYHWTPLAEILLSSQRRP